MANLITGLFDTEAAAEQAVRELKNLGYTQDEISIIMRDRTNAEELAEEAGTRTMSGVGTGAVIGGAIGAVLAGLLAVGSVTIPGVAVVVAGPLAALLAGAGTGGIAGGLIGWLASIGVSHEVAPFYERGLSEGGVVVAIGCHPGDESRVRQTLFGAVAYSGYNTPGYVTPEYSTRFTDIAPPAKTADFAGVTSAGGIQPDPTRSASSVAAEQRSEQRTADEHQREERRDLNRTNPVSGTVAAAQNEADRIKTGMQNQADKLSSGFKKTEDQETIPNSAGINTGAIDDSA
jgi:hypothetical protein